MSRARRRGLESRRVDPSLDSIGLVTIRIGISGWRYAPWRGVFYPRGLPQRDELGYASRCFDSIEVNGSFYSLQTPASYASWHDATPGDFVFAVKGPRYLTHMLRLREAGKPLANFLASGILRLGAKLGPILWQLPPTLRYDVGEIEAFLSLLPSDTGQALALARRRDIDRMRGRSALAIDANRPLRHAMEVRHESFRDPAFVAQLRRHGIALVVADTAGKWPYAEDVTSDFVYVRLHGDAELYASGYSASALDRWSVRIGRWAAGKEPPDARRMDGPAPARKNRDVYCYFDNDAKVHAPFDALALMRKLGLSQVDSPAAGLRPGRLQGARDAPPALAGGPSAPRQPRRHPDPATGSARRRPGPA